MNTEKQYLCKLHNNDTYTNIFPLSPCRYICLQCNSKNINGYTNPDHESNPFGYCYLAPSICIKCSVKNKQCMWCIPK